MAEINKPTDLNKIWASSGVAITPSDAKIAQGWVVEAPGHQTENYINKKHDTAIAHINQHGIPVWDSTTEYQANKSWTLGSNGNLYYCKVTNAGNDPVTDLSESYWRKVLDGQLVITSPEVSAYMKTLLNDADADTALTTLGATTLGKSLFSASSQATAQTSLGGTTVGKAMFTAANEAAGRTAIGVVAASESTAGIMEVATDAETITGTDDTRAISPKKLRLGFNISLAATGFVAFPSWMGGLIIKWGSTPVNADSSTTVATAFPSLCLQGVVSLGMATAATDYQPPKCVPSGTNLVIYNSDNNLVTVRYIAIGY